MSLSDILRQAKIAILGGPTQLGLSVTEAAHLLEVSARLGFIDATGVLTRAGQHADDLVQRLSERGDDSWGDLHHPDLRSARSHSSRSAEG